MDASTNKRPRRMAKLPAKLLDPSQEGLDGGFFEDQAEQGSQDYIAEHTTRYKAYQVCISRRSDNSGRPTTPQREERLSKSCDGTASIETTRLRRTRRASEEESRREREAANELAPSSTWVFSFLSRVAAGKAHPAAILKPRPLPSRVTGKRDPQELDDDPIWESSRHRHKKARRGGWIGPIADAVGQFLTFRDAAWHASVAKAVEDASEAAEQQAEKAAQAAAAQFGLYQASEVAMQSRDSQCGDQMPAMPAHIAPHHPGLPSDQPAQVSRSDIVARSEKARSTDQQAACPESCVETGCMPSVQQPQSQLQGPNAILRACQEAVRPLGSDSSQAGHQEWDPSQPAELTARAASGGAAPQTAAEAHKAKLPPIWQPPSSQQLALRQSCITVQLPHSSALAPQRVPFPSGTFVYSSGIAQLKSLVPVQGALQPAADMHHHKLVSQQLPTKQFSFPVAAAKPQASKRPVFNIVAYAGSYEPPPFAQASTLGPTLKWAA